jgi:hypothetical protein
MGRPKKQDAEPKTQEPANVIRPLSEVDDLPAMLARAKAMGDEQMVAAILKHCSE